MLKRKDDQKMMIEQMNIEINIANSRCAPNVGPSLRRDQVLLDIDLDEITEEIISSENEDDSLNEAEPLDEDSDEEEVPVLAYIPFGSHNIQLVLKDGLNLNDKYTTLINRVSKDIVSKAKFSTVIAEELRKLNKRLHKSVVTRWNSILVMIRSVVNISNEEFAIIKSAMPVNTKKQKETKKKISITAEERETLHELKDILEMFEFVTDELKLMT